MALLYDKQCMSCDARLTFGGIIREEAFGECSEETLIRKRIFAEGEIFHKGNAWGGIVRGNVRE